MRTGDDLTDNIRQDHTHLKRLPKPRPTSPAPYSLHPRRSFYLHTHFSDTLTIPGGVCLCVCYHSSSLPPTSAFC